MHADILFIVSLAASETDYYRDLSVWGIQNRKWLKKLYAYKIDKYIKNNVQA